MGLPVRGTRTGGRLSSLHHPVLAKSLSLALVSNQIVKRMKIVKKIKCVQRVRLYLLHLALVQVHRE